MPLYEFECAKCRDNVERSLKALEKKRDKKTVKNLVEKYENIYAIEIIDLESEKIVARHGRKGKDSVFNDFYLNDGTLLALFNMRNYRFSELIYEEGDEKNVKCYCGGEKESGESYIDFCFYQGPFNRYAEARSFEPAAFGKKQNFRRRLYRGKGQA